MEAAVVRQFLDFFQDYLHLCQSAEWPNNQTSETEIKNAFLISQHIEKCLDKLQKKDILNEFLANVSSNQDVQNASLKNCFSDPPKYVLKKIINSKTKITQMDIGFKCFLQIFSEEKLENCLADIMLEAASKETLLRNLSQEIPKEKILEFKSHLFLSEINQCDNPRESFLAMFDNCTQETVDIIVAQRPRGDAVHGGAQVRGGGVPRGARHQRHHHRRRDRHQPSADSRQRIPEARLGAPADPARPRGRRADLVHSASLSDFV